MKKRIGSFLLQVCLLACLLPTVALAADAKVDLYPQDSSAAQVWTVQVASGSQANCETVVKRLREAGYNAFLYRETGKTNCRLCVGIFSNVTDAEALATKIHEGPEVKGINVEKAYGTRIQPGSACEKNYADPYWGTGPVSPSPKPKADTDEPPIDIFENSSEKIVAVQVAASTSEANSKTCVGRLRDAGYNAYIFKPYDKQRYQLVIGCFDSEKDARSLLEELHELDPIKGVSVEKAFAVTLWVPKKAVDDYTETDYEARLEKLAEDKKVSPSPTPDPVLGTVELFREDDGGNTGVAIQVASSGDLSACVTCVKRLRDAGYNAYLYQASGESRYRLCIGFFGSKADANKVLEQVHSGPAVKGVSMDRGYLINTVLPADRSGYYSGWSY